MNVKWTEWPRIEHVEARRIYRYLYEVTDGRMAEITTATNMDEGIVHSHLLHYEPGLWYRCSTSTGEDYYHVRQPTKIDTDFGTTIRFTFTDL